jgi:hypothetical protein
MGSRLACGIVAGVAGGVVYGVMLHIMTVPAPGYEFLTGIQLFARAVGSDLAVAGWAVHLVVSAAIGALFGLLAGALGREAGAVAAWGLVFALAFFALDILVVTPRLLGLPPVAALAERALWAILPGSLMGHLVYAAVLAGGFLWLRARLGGGGAPGR